MGEAQGKDPEQRVEDALRIERVYAKPTANEQRRLIAGVAKILGIERTAVPEVKADGNPREDS